MLKIKKLPKSHPVLLIMPLNGLEESTKAVFYGIFI